MPVSNASWSCCDPIWEILQISVAQMQSHCVERRWDKLLNIFLSFTIKLNLFFFFTSKWKFFTYIPGANFSLQFSSTHTSFRSKLWKLFPWNTREKMILLLMQTSHFSPALSIYWTAEQDQQHCKFPLLGSTHLSYAMMTDLGDWRNAEGRKFLVYRLSGGL